MTQTCSPSNSLVLNWRRGPFAGYALTIHDRKVLLHWPKGEELPYPKLLFIQGPRGAMLRSIGDDVNVNGVVSDVHWLAPGDELSHPRFAARVGFESNSSNSNSNEQPDVHSEIPPSAKRPGRPARAWRRIRRDIRRLESQWAGLDQVIQGDISLRLEQMTEKLETLSSQLMMLPTASCAPATRPTGNESSRSVNDEIHSFTSDFENQPALVESQQRDPEPSDSLVQNLPQDDNQTELNSVCETSISFDRKSTQTEELDVAAPEDTCPETVSQPSGFVVWNDDADAKDSESNRTNTPAPAISDRTSRFFRKSRSSELSSLRSELTKMKDSALAAPVESEKSRLDSDVESADASTSDVPESTDESALGSRPNSTPSLSDAETPSRHASPIPPSDLVNASEADQDDGADDVLDKATASLNAYALASTTVSTPARTRCPDPAPAVSDAAGNEPSSGDDVSSYMAMFFSRLNLNVATTQESADGNKNRQQTAAPGKTSLGESSTAGALAVAEEAPTNEEYIPQSQAPERKIDLNSLRQLANQSTRNAIQSFAQRKKLQGKTTNLLWMGGAFAASVLLLAVSRQPGDLMFLAGITILVSSTIASIWLLLKETIMERLALLRLPSSLVSSTAPTADEQSSQPWTDEPFVDSESGQDPAAEVTNVATSQADNGESPSSAAIERA